MARGAYTAHVNNDEHNLGNCQLAPRHAQYSTYLLRVCANGGSASRRTAPNQRARALAGTSVNLARAVSGARVQPTAAAAGTVCPAPCLHSAARTPPLRCFSFCALFPERRCARHPPFPFVACCGKHLFVFFAASLCCTFHRCMQGYALHQPFSHVPEALPPLARAKAATPLTLASPLFNCLNENTANPQTLFYAFTPLTSRSGTSPVRTSSHPPTTCKRLPDSTRCTRSCSRYQIASPPPVHFHTSPHFISPTKSACPLGAASLDPNHDIALTTCRCALQTTPPEPLDGLATPSIFFPQPHVSPVLASASALSRTHPRQLPPPPQRPRHITHSTALSPRPHTITLAHLHTTQLA